MLSAAAAVCVAEQPVLLSHRSVVRYAAAPIDYAEVSCCKYSRRQSLTSPPAQAAECEQTAILRGLTSASGQLCCEAAASSGAILQIRNIIKDMYN